jgi:hypothetical protein
MNYKWDILRTFSDPYYNPNLSYLNYYKIDHTKKEERIKKLGSSYKHRLSRRRMLALEKLRILRRKL